MAEVDVLIAESSAYLAEWIAETEKSAAAKLAAAQKLLRDELKASDNEMLRTIHKVVDDKVRDAERLVTERVAVAQRAEAAARDALAKARESETEVNRRLRETMTVNVSGVVGPAARQLPLGDLLKSRFTRAQRYKDEPPPDGWYLVGGIAFSPGSGPGESLSRAMSLDQADRHADSVLGAVVGIYDDSLASLVVAHSCSLYGSAEVARSVGELAGAYVKTWRLAQTRLSATEYASRTFAAQIETGRNVQTWLRDTKRFEIVPVTVKGATQHWVFDLRRGLDVASWTEEIEDAYQQLLAAGVQAVKETRKRPKGERSLYGVGFWLTDEVLNSRPPRPRSLAAPTPPPVPDSAAESSGSQEPSDGSVIPLEKAQE